MGNLVYQVVCVFPVDEIVQQQTDWEIRGVGVEVSNLKVGFLFLGALKAYELGEEFPHLVVGKSVFVCHLRDLFVQHVPQHVSDAPDVLERFQGELRRRSARLVMGYAQVELVKEDLQIGQVNVDAVLAALYSVEHLFGELTLLPFLDGDQCVLRVRYPHHNVGHLFEIHGLHPDFFLQ